MAMAVWSCHTDFDKLTTLVDSCYFSYWLSAI
jgi:hypothetical protein